MPPQITLVHHDPAFLAPAAKCLQTEGFLVASLASSLAAWERIKQPDTDILITTMRFRDGEPNGLALALAARLANPGIRVLFLSADVEDARHVKDVGGLLRLPIAPSALVAHTRGLIGRKALDRNRGSEPEFAACRPEITADCRPRALPSGA